MRSVGKLSVDIGDILGRPGSTKRLEFSERVEGLVIPLARVSEGTDLVFRLRCDALVEGIHVSGPVRGELSLECRRCATEFRRGFELGLDEIFAYDRIGEDDLLVQGERIELEPVVRDAILLDLPQNPLCREDCRGLCPVCGEDRNDTDCGHRAERVELRWEPLRRLIEGD